MANPLAVGPAELHDMGVALEAAWSVLLLTDRDGSMDRPAARAMLARRITEAAARGETDRERLKDYALQGFLGP